MGKTVREAAEPAEKIRKRLNLIPFHGTVFKDDRQILQDILWAEFFADLMKKERILINSTCKRAPKR